MGRWYLTVDLNKLNPRPVMEKAKKATWLTPTELSKRSGPNTGESFKGFSTKQADLQIPTPVLP